MSTFIEDYEALQKADRDKYVEVYHELGELMFEECDIPTVGDFANILKKSGDTEKARRKLEQITSFTGNTKDIETSIAKRNSKYSDEESITFMKKVIASNINDITKSGFFYKKLISSCDNMRIDTKKSALDCGSEGELFLLSDIDEGVFNYKIKTHFIQELYKYVEDYDEFIKLCREQNLEEVHVRNFLTCKHSANHRTFCPRCAGLYRRSKMDTFIPKNIGLYSTLMITEHATQASLDSMNKGRSTSLNTLLEEPLDEKNFKTYEDVKQKIEEIIDDIGDIGVMSKYYEVALLSRFYRQSDGSYKPSALISSFHKQGDKLGQFIYQPTENNFYKLISASTVDAKSLKSKIMFDIYE